MTVEQDVRIVLAKCRRRVVADAVIGRIKTKIVVVLVFAEYGERFVGEVCARIESSTCEGFTIVEHVLPDVVVLFDAVLGIHISVPDRRLNAK